MKICLPKYNWQYYKFGTISLCMIMRNNAKVLQRCLDSVRGLVNEVVIVDTGSEDNSIELAIRNEARVFTTKWDDDFSAPRNLSIANATKDWVLIMDPDEIIMRKDHEEIRWLTRAKNVVAIRMTTRNYGASPLEANYRTLVGHKDPTGQFEGFVPSTKTRFFKNGLGMHFEGCWHELLDWDISRRRLPVGTCKVPIHHWTGEISQKSVEEKKRFYLRLGYKKVKEMPLNGQAWWELAVAQAISAQRSAAAHSLAQAFRLGFGWQHQFFLLARILRILGKQERAKYAFEKGVCKLFPMLTHTDPAKRPIEPLIQDL